LPATTTTTLAEGTTTTTSTTTSTTTTTQPLVTTSTTTTTTTTTLPSNLCPSDPNKTEPGICGCGISDTDTDEDGTVDCNDKCPDDPDKTEPGNNGCGISEDFIFPGIKTKISPTENITVIFEEFVALSVITVSETDASPPSGFRFYGQPYDIDCTATYNGNVTVCIRYYESELRGEETGLQLMHREDSTSEWVDVTTSLDTKKNIICGEVESFSEFAVVEAKTNSGGGGGDSDCFIGTLFD
jgi:hypothetical protein